MKAPSSRLLLNVACVAALFALALMVWGMLSPTVIPVMVSMTIGQAIGTLSFLLFLYVVFRDLRKTRVLSRTRRTTDSPSRTTDSPK